MMIVVDDHHEIALDVDREVIVIDVDATVVNVNAIGDCYAANGNVNLIANVNCVFYCP